MNQGQTPMRPDPLAADIAVGPSRRGAGGKGFLFLLALIVLAGAGYFGWLKVQDLRRFSFRIRMTSAEGLASGSPVRIAGVTAGRISEIAFGPGRLDPDHLYPVLTLRIDRKLASSLRADLTARVDTVLIFGENALLLTPGTPAGREVFEGEIIDLVPAAGEEKGLLAKAARGLKALMDSGEGGASLPAPEVRALLTELQHLEERVDRLEETVRALQRHQTSMP